jgi:hypothetical protein
MKTLAKILTAIFLFTGPFTYAQMQQNDERSGQDHSYTNMMQTGMMGGNMMMQNGMMGNMCPMCGAMSQNMPMQKYMMTVMHLPDMQKQLSLTDDQTEQLIDYRADFKKQLADYHAELNERQMKLEKLLDKNPSTSEVKAMMEECAEMNINIKASAYDTAGKMTAEQKQNFYPLMMQQTKMMQKQKGMMQGYDMQGGMNQNMMNN